MVKKLREWLRIQVRGRDVTNGAVAILALLSLACLVIGILKSSWIAFLLAALLAVYPAMWCGVALFVLLILDSGLG